jgi:hypothetical protein
MHLMSCRSGRGIPMIRSLAISAQSLDSGSRVVGVTQSIDRRAAASSETQRRRLLEKAYFWLTHLSLFEDRLLDC